MQETLVRFLGWEDPLEKGQATHSGILGFPDDSDGKEFTCNVGDMVWENPLEEGMAAHSSILAWRILIDRGAWWATVHGVTKSQTRLSD